MGVRINKSLHWLSAPLSVVAACSFLSDPAVDLATCIRAGADDMPASSATREVSCPVRSGRTVTVILVPPSQESTVVDVAALRLIGVPDEAIYYHGPDAPSVGQPRGLGAVNVYDAHFSDNRKYSNSSALGPRVKIAMLMAKTGDGFRVTLRRGSDKAIEVVGLAATGLR